MNRRDFLAGLVTTVAGVLVPEPPRVRAYSFAPDGGWPVRSIVPPWHPAIWAELRARLERCASVRTTVQGDCWTFIEFNGVRFPAVRVHDEIVCEVPAAVAADMMALMRDSA